jgi:hypothetical protein
MTPTPHHAQAQYLPLSRAAHNEAAETSIIAALVEMLDEPGNCDLAEINGELVLVRTVRAHRAGMVSPPAFSPDARARYEGVIMAA